VADDIYVQGPGHLSRPSSIYSTNSKISRQERTWTPSGQQRPSSVNCVKNTITPSLADYAQRNGVLQETGNQSSPLSSPLSPSSFPGSSRTSAYELDARRLTVELPADPVKQQPGIPGSPHTVRSQGFSLSPGSPISVNGGSSASGESGYNRTDTPDFEDYGQSPYTPAVPPRSPRRIIGRPNTTGLRGGTAEPQRSNSLQGFEGHYCAPDQSQNEDSNLQQTQYITSLEERIKNIELQLARASKATHQQHAEPEEIRGAGMAPTASPLASAPPLALQRGDESSKKFVEIEKALKKLESTVAAPSQERRHNSWGHSSRGRNYQQSQ
jgi:hypothetical protein